MGAVASFLVLSCSAGGSQFTSPAKRARFVCNGPEVVRADVRAIAAGHRRDPSETARRLELLTRAHCPLAKRLLDEVHSARRVPDRSQRFPPSARSNSCVTIDDTSLFAIDVGEWGGGVDVVDRSGHRKIFDGNVQSLTRSSAGLVAVGGLSHMLPGWGFLGEVAVDANGPRIASVACLPSEPEGAAVDEDGTLVVVLTVSHWLTRDAPPPREMTIALDDDGSLYDIACDTGNPGERLPTSWETSQDAHGCMARAWGSEIPRN